MTLNEFKNVCLFVGRAYGKNFMLMQGAMKQAINSIGTHLHAELETMNKVFGHLNKAIAPKPEPRTYRGQYLPPPHPMAGEAKVFDRKGRRKR